MNRRTMFLLATAEVLLLLAVGWAHERMSAGRQSAEQAWADLAAARRDAERIATFRRQPAQARDTERLDSETIRLIEQAARESGIAPEGISRITPESARRVGDTVYKEKPTAVLLQNVSIRQVVTFAHRLVSGEGGLSARSLRLSAPRHSPGDSNWTAELVLTYLVYDPIRAGQ